VLRLPRQLIIELAGTDLLAPMLRAVGRGLVTIFTLHRFTDPEHGIVGHDPVALAKQLAYLRRYRYTLLSLSEVVDRITGRNGHSASPAVAFTVDDGYGDFVRIGARVFAEYDCPVTVFIPTGFLDGRLWLWWDRVTYLFANARRASFLTPSSGICRISGRRPKSWHACSSMCSTRWSACRRRNAKPRSLHCHANWRWSCRRRHRGVCAHALDEVRKMARQGVTFGPHTVTHPILPLTPPGICQWEIEESSRRLRLETSSTIPVFCYPAGHAGRRELQRPGGRVQRSRHDHPRYAAPHGIRDWGRSAGSRCHASPPPRTGRTW